MPCVNGPSSLRSRAASPAARRSIPIPLDSSTPRTVLLCPRTSSSTVHLEALRPVDPFPSRTTRAGSARRNDLDDRSTTLRTRRTSTRPTPSALLPKRTHRSGEPSDARRRAVVDRWGVQRSTKLRNLVERCRRAARTRQRALPGEARRPPTGLRWTTSRDPELARGDLRELIRRKKVSDPLAGAPKHKLTETSGSVQTRWIRCLAWAKGLDDRDDSFLLHQVCFLSLYAATT